MGKLKGRIDFILAFDVQDGNPNGNPDNGNQPRMDVEKGVGLVTDVCLKRKVRNYIQVVKNCSEGFDIFIKEKAVLDALVEKVYDFKEIDVLKNEMKKNKKSTEEIDKAIKAKVKELMCKYYYDIRTFGAVIATTKKQDQVRGPIQMTFARSVDPIWPQNHSITRMAVTKEADLNKERTMGSKSTVPYGLYVCHGFISANLAKLTGFSEEDLELFWDALKNMFDCDRSAARGLMSTQKLIVFRHESELGNAPANKLFDLVKIEKVGEGVARSFSDYKVTIDKDNLPASVTIEELL